MAKEEKAETKTVSLVAPGGTKVTVAESLAQRLKDRGYKAASAK